MTARTIVRMLAGLCLATVFLCTGSVMIVAQQTPAASDSSAAIPAITQGGDAGTQNAVQGGMAGTQSAAQGVAAVPVPRIIKVTTDAASLGDDLYVQIDSASAAAIEQNQISYRSLELFLDGMRFHSLNPQFIGPHTLVFPLTYDDSSRQQWRMLLGSLRESSHQTRIGVGYEGGQEILPASNIRGYIPTFTFIIYREGWFLLSVLGVLLALVLFWLLAVKSDIIRDSNPPEPSSGNRRPYSLSRFQMAVWFFVVIISYMFIFLLTGQYNNVLNDQALILMGIGAGTALGAAMIDSNKNSTARSSLITLNAQKSKVEAELRDLMAQLADNENYTRALSQPQQQQPQATADTPPPAPAPAVSQTSPTDPQLQELVQARQTLKGQIADQKSQLASLKEQIDNVYSNLQEPVSEGFLRDILTDSNGISFHRFQIVMWTLVLVVIFSVQVYQDLLMPDFSATLLALMGISSGTYLGFKVPEQQTQPVQPEKQTTQS